MSFWKNPQYNGIKVFVLVIVIILIGFFVYQSMHQNALQDTGRVLSPGATTVSTTGAGTTSSAGTTTGTATGSNPGTSTGTATGSNPGTSTGTTGKGGTTGSPVICNPTVPVVLAPSYVPGTSVTAISVTDTGYPNANVSLGTYQLANNSACQMQVTMMRFETHQVGLPTSGYSLIQQIHLVDMNTGLPFGTTLPLTDAPGPVTPLGQLLFTSSGDIIPPYTTESFELIANGQNVPPPAHFRIQLVEFSATNVLTSAIDHALYPTSMGLVLAPTVTMVR